MKIDPSKLQFTREGHVLLPAMYVDCSRRGVQRPAGGKPSGYQGASGQSTGTDSGGTDGTGGEGTDSDPDIVSVFFRLISAALVSPGLWFAPDQLVDFRHADARALKEATSIINTSARPVPVMWNHTFDMQAKAGRLGMAYWEQSVDIAPGVNAPVVVNRRYDQKAAVGLETGEINAGSIGIDNSWSLSHPDMDFEEFVARQGEDIDGEQVRWLPEHTIDIDHYAMVPAGADPDAGPRSSQLERTRFWPGFGSVPAAAPDVGDGMHSGASGATDTHKGGREMKKFTTLLQLVCAQLGISAVLTENGPLPEKLDERVQAELEGIVGAARKYNSLAAAVEQFGPQMLREGEVKLTAEQVLERLPAELAFVPQGKQYLEDVRTEVLKLFDTVHVKPDKQESLGEVELRERKRIESSMDLQYLKDQTSLLKPNAGSRFGPNFKVSENEDPAGGGNRMDADVDRRIQAQLLKERLGKK